MLPFERNVYVVPRHVVPLDTAPHRELRRGVRSWRAIQEEDFQRLRDCANRRMHSNDVTHYRSTSTLGTLNSPKGRDPLQRKPSFEGTRENVVIPEENAYGRAIRRYIDQQLREIFPPLPEKPSEKAVLGDIEKVSGGDGAAPSADLPRVVDSRDPVKRLWYTPHTGLPDADGSDDAAEAAAAVMEPLSPFAERSRAFPGPLAFHPPVGLPLLLQRIRANKVVTAPPFDPAVEMFRQHDPPMTDDERCVSSLVASVMYDGQRAPLPVLTPPPADRVLSKSLYQKSSHNKEVIAQQRAERHRQQRTLSTDYSRRDSSTTVATLMDTASQVRLLPKPLSLGDVLLRSQR